MRQSQLSSLALVCYSISALACCSGIASGPHADGGAPSVDQGGESPKVACVGASSADCALEHGKGTQWRTCEDGVWSEYSACTPVSCDPGYFKNNGQCLETSCAGASYQDCAIQNGQGRQWRSCNNGVWDEFAACTLVSCDQGYGMAQDGNSCVAISCQGASAQDCDIEHGDGIQTRSCNDGVWTEFSSCTPVSCDNDYTKDGDLCVSLNCQGESSQDCNIAHGTGTQWRSCIDGVWSEFNACTPVSCDLGFTKSGDQCLAVQCNGDSTKSCVIAHGSGSQSRTCQDGVWSEFSTCTVVSCDNGYEINGDHCFRILRPVLYLPFVGGKNLDRSGQGNDAYLYYSDSFGVCSGINKPCTTFGKDLPGYPYAPMEIPFRDSLTFEHNQDYSIAMWFRNDMPTANGELIHAPHNGDAYAYRLYSRTDGSYAFCAYDGQTAACAEKMPVNPGGWNLVVGVKHNAQICIGINDNPLQCAALSLSASTRASDGRVLIGRHPSRVNNLNGALADIQIYNYALVADDIQALHANQAVIQTCDAGDSDCCGNGVCDAGENVGTCVVDCSDCFWEERFMREYFQYPTRRTLNHDTEGYAYWTNLRIRPLLNMYEKSNKEFYILRALTYAENAIAMMQDVGGDGKLEWACVGSDQAYCYDHDTNAATPKIKYALAVMRASREITAVARLIYNTSSLFAYRPRAWELHQRIKYHVVANPIYTSRFRCPCPTDPGDSSNCIANPNLFVCNNYDDGFAPVHHMVVHETTVLRNLHDTSTNDLYKGWFIAKAIGLKDATFSHPTASGVIWGSSNCVDMVYDYPKCYNGWDPIVSSCTDSQGNTYCFPMDIAHSTDYVDTVVQLHRAGYVFDQAYVDSLVDTVKNVLLQQSPDGQYFFRTHLDGKDQPPYTKDGPEIETNSKMPMSWVRNITTPGWMSLAEFDTSLKNSFATIINNTTAEYQLRDNHRLSYISDMAKANAPAP